MKYVRYLALIFIAFILGGCSQYQLQESKNYEINGELHCGYFYQEDILNLTTNEHFMESSWNPVSFEYICEDISCNHKGETCKASFINNKELLERNKMTRNGDCIYSFIYGDKRLIIDTYSDGGKIKNDKELMQFQIKYTYTTDIYEAKNDGCDRKLVMSFEGGIGSSAVSHAAVLCNGKLYFGGMQNMLRTVKKNNKNEIIETNEVSIEHAFYEIDLETYKIRTFGKETTVLEEGYTYQVFQGNDWIYLTRCNSMNQETDCYVINSNTNEYQKILGWKIEKGYIVGILNDSIVIGNNNQLYLYDWLEKDTMDVIYTSEDEELIACVLEDEIWIATDKSFEEKNDYIEYTVFDRDGNVIRTNYYSEYITFLEVMGERVVYLKPLTEGIEEWWCDWDKVSTLEGSTYIGTFFGIDME